jgi:hypothetical protein
MDRRPDWLVCLACVFKLLQEVQYVSLDIPGLVCALQHPVSKVKNERHDYRFINFVLVSR